MIRVFLIILLISLFSESFTQNTISVKKLNTIEGFYQLEKEANSNEYIYFNKEGIVILLFKNYRKKRAMGVIQNCLINDDCSDCKKTTYNLEKNNTIVFEFKKSFKRAPVFTEYRAKLNEDKTELIVKVSKTDLPVEVKKYILKEL